MREARRYWYSAPQFGFGYRAAITWEGWAADLALWVGLLALGRSLHGPDHPLLKLGCFFGLIAALLVIRHWRGEPKSWA